MACSALYGFIEVRFLDEVSGVTEREDKKRNGNKNYEIHKMKR